MKYQYSARNNDGGRERPKKQASLAGLLAAALLGFQVMAPVSQVLAATLKGNTPKDSFLIHRANSVDELVSEIGANPAVRHHYARLYHISDNNVVTYMRDNVRLGKLTRDYRHTVYCVTRSGVIFSVVETLPKGSQVFALNNGRPVLRWVCGNPLTASLPENSPETAMVGEVQFTGPAPHRITVAARPKIAPPPVFTPVTDVIADESPAASVAAVDVVPVEKVAAYAGALHPAAPVLMSGAGVVPASGGIGALPILGLIPIAVILAGSHGHGGSSGSSDSGGATSGATGGTTSGTTGGAATAGTTSGSTTGVATSGGTTSGTTGGTTSGATGGTTSGSTSGSTSGATDSTTTAGTTSGTTGGTTSGATGGTTSGTTGGTTSGTTGGATTGTTGGTTSGTTGGDTTGNTTSGTTGGTTSGTTGGDTTGDTSGSTTGDTTSGATGGDTSGDTAGATSGSTSGDTSGDTGGMATPEPGGLSVYAVFALGLALLAFFASRRRRPL